MLPTKSEKMNVITRCTRTVRQLWWPFVVVVVLMGMVLWTMSDYIPFGPPHFRNEHTRHLSRGSDVKPMHIDHELDVISSTATTERTMTASEPTTTVTKSSTTTTEETTTSQMTSENPDAETNESVISALTALHNMTTQPGEDTTQAMTDVEEEFRQRRKTYEAACDVFKKMTGDDVSGGAKDPYFYLPANLSYCRVPKVGSTFWKRIFFFLYNKTGSASQEVTSPMHLGRLFVHMHSLGREGSVGMEKGKQLLMGTTRVMFARDPWSRLWSGYVDKFILPDSWLDMGVKVMDMRTKLPSNKGKELRSQSPVEKEIKTKGTVPWVLSQTSVDENVKCADDVTFAEFLHFAVHENFNPHWSPVHTQCNPCVYRPHYVGKVETFNRDVAHILNITGLSYLLGKGGVTHDSHVMDELSLLTIYHFQLWNVRKTLHLCLDALGVARRLWWGFQLNAYIPSSTPFPAQYLSTRLQNASLSEIQDHVIEKVREAHSVFSLSKEEWSASRRKILVQAYRSVPPNLLKEVQTRFDLDFALFQYDRQPKDIFGVD